MDNDRWDDAKELIEQPNTDLTNKTYIRVLNFRQISIFVLFLAANSRLQSEVKSSKLKRRRSAKR